MLQDHFASRTNHPIPPTFALSWIISAHAATVEPCQYRASIDAIENGCVRWRIRGGGRFHGSIVDQHIDITTEAGRKRVVATCAAIDEGCWLLGDIYDALGRQALVTVGMVGGEAAVIKVRKLGRSRR
jgi:hypothetical protein